MIGIFDYDLDLMIFSAFSKMGELLRAQRKEVGSPHPFERRNFGGSGHETR